MSAFVTANLGLAAFNLLLSAGNLLGAPWLDWRERTLVIVWIASSVLVWVSIFVAVS